MYLTEILGVAIGLIFVWLLLSIVVQQVQEWIVGWLGLRADSLQDAIWDMLAEPKKRKGPWGRLREQIQKFLKRRNWLQRESGWFVPETPPEIVHVFYEHPFIRSLTQDRSNPSYIPPETFAKTLFSIVMTAGTDKSVITTTLDNFGRELPVIVHELTWKTIHSAVEELIDLAKSNSKDLSKAVKRFEANYPDYAEHFEAIQGAAEDISKKLSKTEADSEIEKVAAKVLEEKKLLNLSDLEGEISKLRALAGARDVNLVELDTAIQSFKVRLPQYSAYLDGLLSVKLPDTSWEALEMVEKGAARLVVRSPELSQLLNDLISSAKEAGGTADKQLAQLRTNTERWFNNTMDRASGWYRRNRQWGAFAIAFFLAVILNVDTVDIGVALWRDPVLRRAVEQQAVMQLEAGLPEDKSQEEDLTVPSPVDTLNDSLSNLQIPFGWQSEPIDSFDPKTSTCTIWPAITPDKDGKRELAGILIDGECRVWSNPPRGWGIAAKLAGILITAFAGMQGAPFWFDMLDKIVNIRASGKSPDD